MSNFIATDFLFFNPEVSAYLNVLTVEQAQSFYDSNPNIHLARNAAIIPAGFNSEVYLTSSRDLANISSLSRVISAAMSNQGLTQSQIAKKQAYVANIYQSVSYQGSNRFVLSGSNIITSNNILAGDTVKIIDSMSTELYFNISTVTSNQFLVNSTNAVLYQSSNYLLFGIRVTDYDRIAQINYARISAGFSNLDAQGGFASQVTSSNTNFLSSASDSNFNASLYRLLYPDSRAFNDVQTYLDWVNKRKNEVYRIINVDDIAAGNGNKYVNFNFLNISSNIVFRGNMVNGITTYLSPALCNIPGDCNKLITEYAIKYYTDDRISNLQNLGSFTNMVISSTLLVSEQGSFSNNVNVYGSLFVNSNSSFSNSVTVVGNTTIKSNLDVTGHSVFRNSMMLAGGDANATFSNCVLVNGSLSVTGNMYNARLGLGYMGSFLTSNNGSNIVQAQNYNDNSDERIKKNITSMSPKDCLDRICKLDITTFEYLYGYEHTDRINTTGVIAQQLERQGLSNYVYYTDGFLPDILKEGSVDGNYLYFEGDLEVGRTVKLIMGGGGGEGTEAGGSWDSFVSIVRKLERGVFHIAPSIIGSKRSCMIYGYRTSTLKNVDYKQLFVLALGAIKELATRDAAT